MSNQPSKDEIFFWTRSGMCRTDGPVAGSTYVRHEAYERLTAALAACQTYDYRTLADEVERLQAALRLAESARDYANDMLDKARGTGETGVKHGQG